MTHESKKSSESPTVAYSYVRFSAKRQERGDSVRRQVEASTKVSAERGWLLDDTLKLSDLGVSAFRSKNATKGKLAAFLQAVEDGRVAPGSVLIIEALDRLSRAEVLTHLNLFISILEAGITIYTSMDRREYTAASVNANPTDLIVSITIMMRAHEESKTKSERVGAAWVNKRKHPEKPLTGKCPSWLTLDKASGKFRFNQRAATMRRIIRWAVEGIGPASIGTRLNRDKVPTFLSSRHWNFSTVRYLLTSRTLIGEYQPCKGRRPEGSPIVGYYPAIATEAQFYAIQNHVNHRKRLARGRTGKDIANLFSGLIVSGNDGSKMQFRCGRKDQPRLNSKMTTEGATHHPMFPYRPFEHHFLHWVKEVQIGDQTPEASVIAELEGQLSEKQRQRDKAKARATKTTGTAFDGLLEMVADLDEQFDEIRQRLEWERARQHKPKVTTDELNKMVESLYALPDDRADERRDMRDKIKSAIRLVVDRITMFTFRRGMMLIAIVNVTLKDGLCRLFICCAGKGRPRISWSDDIPFSYGQYELDGMAMGRALLKCTTVDQMRMASTRAQMDALRPTANPGPKARYTVVATADIDRIVGVA